MDFLPNQKINFNDSVEKLRPTLKPPVANSMIFNDALKVMVVGGPNQRKDFHIERGEELFYQYDGDMDVIIIDPNTKAPRKIHIAEGEIFLLPAGVPHSPQRYANTIGLVMERDRAEEETDCLRWYNENGQEVPDVLYEEYFHCKDLGSEIKACIERFQKQLSDGSLPSPFPAPDPSVGNIQGLLDVMTRAKNVDIMTPFNLRDYLSSNRTSHIVFNSEFIFQAFRNDSSSRKLVFDCAWREVYLWQFQGSCQLRFSSKNTVVALHAGEALLLDSSYANEVIEIQCESEEDILLLTANKFQLPY